MTIRIFQLGTYLLIKFYFWQVSRLRTKFCSTLLHLEPRARAGAENKAKSQSQSREPEPRAMQSREPEPRVRAGADQPRVRAGAVQKTRGSAYTRNHICRLFLESIPYRSVPYQITILCERVQDWGEETGTTGGDVTTA